MKLSHKINPFKMIPTIRAFRGYISFLKNNGGNISYWVRCEIQGWQHFINKKWSEVKNFFFLGHIIWRLTKWIREKKYSAYLFRDISSQKMVKNCLFFSWKTENGCPEAPFDLRTELLVQTCSPWWVVWRFDKNKFLVMTQY